MDEKGYGYELYDENGTFIGRVSEEELAKIMEEQELSKTIQEQERQDKDIRRVLQGKRLENPRESKELDAKDRERRQEKEAKKDEKSKEDDKEEKAKKEKQNEKDDAKQKNQDEEEKKKQTAQALGIDASEVKSVCTINPREKITDTYTLADIMPEAAEYDEISIAYSNQSSKGDGRFTILGNKNDTKTMTPLNSVSPIEGTSSKNVISVNEDGSKVTETQVQGLFQINSRERNDGIAVSFGSNGMINADYVSNVMDKETRRATPIRTKGPENVRMPNYQVRENAGDSKRELIQEGRIFRERQEEGVDPQTLDGIDTDKADGGNITLDELKEQIKEATLEKGEMSGGETREFIESEINKSGLALSDEEIEHTTNEIAMEVLDESRFPSQDIRR